MAPRKVVRQKKKSKFAYWTATCADFLEKQVFTWPMFSNQSHFQLITYLLLVAELFINLFIVNFCKYTEIDWSTYMQQVECFLNGTFDYEQIYGNTGPIVYPAGHLYIYTLLYYLTNRGTNIYLAQNIFAFLYLATLWIVFRLYSSHLKVPPYVILFMVFTSYRVHSIYVLRLFNCSLGILVFYFALYLFTQKKWALGSAFYSFAVSIKMNILLFSPAILLLLCESHSRWGVIKNLAICSGIQLLVGLPFLLTYPISYLKSSFNLGRVFLHVWTVNYRFLPEEIFVNKYFHLSLLGLHIFTLAIMFSKRWLSLKTLFSSRSSTIATSGKSIVVSLFTANLIGIAFARSLHYQFYVWYYHSLPFLLWSTRYKPLTNICIWGIVELCWNVYPSTVWSSALLHVMHLLILIGLFVNKSTNGLALTGTEKIE